MINDFAYIFGTRSLATGPPQTVCFENGPLRLHIFWLAIPGCTNDIKVYSGISDVNMLIRRYINVTLY